MSDTTFELIINVKEDSLNDVAQRNRKALYDAYIDGQKNGSSDALFALLSPDVKFYEAGSLPYGGMKTGIDGAQKGVAEMFGSWKHVRAEFEEMCAAGDLVVCLMNLKNEARTGKTYEGPTAEVFRFKDGKIIEWRPIYWDTHAVRVACGIDEA